MKITTSIKIVITKLSDTSFKMDWEGGIPVIKDLSSGEAGDSFTIELVGEKEITAEDLLKKGGVHVPAQPTRQ